MCCNKFCIGFILFSLALRLKYSSEALPDLLHWVLFLDLIHYVILTNFCSDTQWLGIPSYTQTGERCHLNYI